jgi:hypothetical protein
MDVVGKWMVVAVDDTLIVSKVVIGIETVWIVVPSRNDVALLKDEVVSMVARSRKTRWGYWSQRAVMEDSLLSQEWSAASIRAVGLSVTNGQGYSDSLHLR